jgi:hypothetical protein
MTSSMDLEQVERKARQSVNQDGILYFFMGLLLITVGVSFMIPPLSWIGILGILFVFPAEWLRKRVTYPRIGYAKFQAPPGLWRGMGLFAALAIVALIIAAFVWPQIMSILVGGVFGLSFYFGASMSGIRLRDWVVIGLMLASGVITAVLFDDWHLATSVQLSLIGLILVLIGLIDLVHFIRTYPMIDGEFETDQGGL